VDNPVRGPPDAAPLARRAAPPGRFHDHGESGRPGRAGCSV